MEMLFDTSIDIVDYTDYITPEPKFSEGYEQYSHMFDAILSLRRKTEVNAFNKLTYVVCLL